jgi:DNA-binding NarL/FixJ family response regulator
MLADDHPMFRSILKKILGRKNNLLVVGEAGDGAELLTLLDLSKLAPHLVILDISMPNLNGIKTARKIKEIHPDMKILMLTIHKDKDFLRQAISSGANGYLLKEETEMELFSAIETIQKGGLYVSPVLSGTLENEKSSPFSGNK